MLASKVAFCAGQVMVVEETEDFAGDVGRPVALNCDESRVKSSEVVTLRYISWFSGSAYNYERRPIRREADHPKAVARREVTESHAA